MKKPRVTKSQKIQRANILRDQLLKGVPDTTIVKVYSEKWNCTAANVRLYLAEIHKDFREAELEKLPALKNKYLARLELMFHEAYSDKNMKTALDIQKEIHKICGLHDEKRDDLDRAPIITISSRDVTPLHHDRRTLQMPEGSTNGSRDEGHST